MIPTSLVIAIVLDGLLRASYDAISREALHVLGVRRRAIVVGEGEHLEHLLRTLGSVRGGIDYEFVGVVERRGQPDARAAAARASSTICGPCWSEHPADELIVTDSDYSDRQLLQIVEHAHRSAVKVRIAPKTTELLVQRAEYVPGQGVPLFELRPPVFVGARLGGQAHVRPVVGAFVILVGLPLWLAIAAAIKLTSRRPGLLPRPAHRPRRAAVRDVQVPDDGRRRRRPAGGARAARTRPRARSSRSATTRASRPSGGSSAASRSTSSRTCSTSCAAR